MKRKYSSTGYLHLMADIYAGRPQNRLFIQSLQAMKHHHPTKTQIISGICMSFAYILIGVFAGFTPYFIHLEDSTKNLVAHITVGGIFILYGIFRAIWGMTATETAHKRSATER